MKLTKLLEHKVGQLVVFIGLAIVFIGDGSINAMEVAILSNLGKQVLTTWTGVLLG